MVIVPAASFSLVIEFERHSPDPGRVFRAAEGLISLFQEIDRDLAGSIDSKIEPVMMLEDVEAGSLRIWLAQLVNSIDDEALKKLDWKPAVGIFLVKAKYKLVEWMNRSGEVKEYKDLAALSGELRQLAE